MAEQITLEQALELVDFDRRNDGVWFVKTVKGYCHTVESNCVIIKGYCHIVEGDCSFVRGNCHTVEGSCGTVKGNCHTVEGRVLSTINGREWQYVETPREQMARLIEGGASKEELLKALEEL